jgi:DNA repair exonuclease SbcCD nuclease subunit
MLNQALNIAVFSDVHLGHRRTPTESIIENLKRDIPDTAATADLDVLFIPGDLFDRLLNLPDNTVYEIHAWIARLLKICKRRDIVLRVLEGTPSHDWKQSRLVESINVDVGIGADARHVPELSIEHHERFGMDILYLPDEWSSDNDDTWKQVRQLMAEHRLDQVDFVMMHGQFPYQLPPHVNVPTHDPDRYADLARHYVFCGHVHIPSRYRNILVPGSYDRLTHGEEHAKGHWRLRVDPNGDDSVVFHENTGATLYRSIDCTGLEMDAALAMIERELVALPDGAHTRIVADRNDPVAASLTVLQRKHPEFRWTSKLQNKSKSGKEMLQDMRAKYQTKPITARTINEMVADRLKRMDCDESTIHQCMTALTEVH